MRNKETILQDKIRIGVSDIAVTFRANVGTFIQGDRYISTGLPNVIDVNSVYELSKKWIAKPIKITVSENEYNGSTYMNVTKIAESNFKEVNHKYVSANNTNNNAASGFVPQSNNDFIPF